MMHRWMLDEEMRGEYGKEGDGARYVVHKHNENILSTTLQNRARTACVFDGTR